MLTLAFRTWGDTSGESEPEYDISLGTVDIAIIDAALMLLYGMIAQSEGFPKSDLEWISSLREHIVDGRVL